MLASPYYLRHRRIRVPLASFSVPPCSVEVAVAESKNQANDGGRGMWRKGSWSTFNGTCVEVGKLHGREIGIRDSKDMAGA